jgi:Archaeal adenylate kinase
VIGRTIFIAGAYGTGKSILCSRLEEKLNIPAFSAGNLISDQNGEIYGSNKAVADKDNNQLLLARQVQKLNSNYESILLAGHFCIFNSANQVELLPKSVFLELNILRIILLEASSAQINKHLKQRDSKTYHKSSIDELILQERTQADIISTELNCPFTIYQMTFSDIDSEKISDIVRGG